MGLGRAVTAGRGAIRLLGTAHAALVAALLAPGAGMVSIHSLDAVPDAEDHGVAAILPAVRGRVPQAPTPPGRSEDLDRIVEEAGYAFDLPGDLIHALIDVESKGDHDRRSGTGCRGLMQVGGRWSDYRGVIVRHDLVNDPMNVRSHVFVGASILADMKERIPRRWFWSREDRLRAVIAAYNVGQMVVRRAVKRARRAVGHRPTWRQVYARITPELLAGVPSYAAPPWNDRPGGVWSRVSKVRHLRHFVRSVFRGYHRLQAEGRLRSPNAALTRGARPDRGG